MVRKLNWVVTPADGPFGWGVSAFFFAKSNEQCEDCQEKNCVMLAYKQF